MWRRVAMAARERLRVAMAARVMACGDDRERGGVWRLQRVCGGVSERVAPRLCGAERAAAGGDGRKRGGV